MAIYQAKPSNLFIGLAVALVTSSILVAAGLYTFYQVKANALKAQAIAQQQNRAEAVKRQLEDYLQNARQLTKTTTSLLASMKGDQQRVEATLLQILQSSPPEIIYGIGAWYEPHQFDPTRRYYGPYAYRGKTSNDLPALTYQWMTPDYNFHHQRWYQAGKAAKGYPVFIEPYLDTDLVYITLAQAFYYPPDHLVGIVTVDMVLPVLQDLILKANTQPGEVVYVTTAKDVIFIHPDAQQILAFAKRTGLNPASILDLNQHHLTAFNQAYRPNPSVQTTATVQYTDWIVHVVTDEAQLFQEVVKLRDNLLLLTGVLCLLSSLGVFLLRWIYAQRTQTDQLKQENTLLEREIAERKQIEAALRQAEEKYRSIFEHSTQGIFQISPDGHYISANPALAHIYGYGSPQELITTLAKGEHHLYVNPQHQQEFVAAIAQQGCVTNFEVPIHRKDGEMIWISENARAVYDSNQVLICYEGTVTDVTGRKRTDARLRQYAFYDLLTGLPNQTLFLERVGKAIHQAKLDESSLFAVLHVALDRFHRIKYSFGYQVAEQLLVASVDRLVSFLPSSTLIARVGADDFAILLEAIPHPNYATALADRIHQAFTTPFNLKGRDVFTTASLGLTFSSIGHEYPEDFLQAADIAMHQSKALDLPHPLVFTTTMQTEAIARLQLDTDLRQALKRQEFQLYYQPIVSLANNHQVIGVEALVRWQNKLRGLIPPSEFIALAETTRLIIPLGNWILREACRQLQIWQQMFANPALFVSVNVSPLQLAQPDFLDQVDQALQENHLAPSSLKLEITEGAVMENSRWVTEKLEQLKARKIRLCIDDFGTGYSSLSYLHSFPFDTLKIDRCFITCLGKDNHSLEIVRTIIMLAQTLGMDVVAEGIETSEQLAHLKTLPCEYGQGYLFAQSLESSAVEQLLKQKSQGLNNVTVIDYYSRLSS